MPVITFERFSTRKRRADWRGLLTIAVAILLCPTICLAQRVSMGVVGGAYLNSDFDSFYSPAIPGRMGFDLVLPDSGGFLIGPAAEIRISDRFAVELAALYKPLHYEDAPVFQNESIVAAAPNTVVTWQYPLLLRYRTNAGGVRPFLEAGPSFRSTGNLNRADPSHLGVTAGAGVEIPWRKVRFSPAIRYTRWREDDADLQVRTRPDQLELVAGIHYGASGNGRPLGRRVRLGAVIGSTVTKHGRREEFTSSGPGGSFLVFESSPQRQTLAAGPKVEILLGPKASLEVNALPRSFRSVVRVVRSQGDIPIPGSVETTSGGLWEFPFLVKYRFMQHSSARPLIELGPSFRLPKELASAKISTYGLTAGVGAEIAAGPIKIEPAVRLTHWGPDTQVSSGGDARTGVFRNQVQVVAAFSF